MSCAVTNVAQWIAENRKDFAPPVCNKLMHGGQLKIMFIGGPNERKDFHLEPGEELFYQIKGDMIVRTVIQERYHDVHIREGEIFVLPGHTCHSPQRFADTVGLVVERDRYEFEHRDSLLWFVPDEDADAGRFAPQVLYQEFFHCRDLGTELPPVINRFRTSPEGQTGRPQNPPTVPPPSPLPIVPDWGVDLSRPELRPFSLRQWLADRSPAETGRLSLFDRPEFKVDVVRATDAAAASVYELPDGELWLLVLAGAATVEIGDETRALSRVDDSLLVAQGTTATLTVSHNSAVMAVRMTPPKKPVS